MLFRSGVKYAANITKATNGDDVGNAKIDQIYVVVTYSGGTTSSDINPYGIRSNEFVSSLHKLVRNIKEYSVTTLEKLGITISETTKQQIREQHNKVVSTKFGIMFKVVKPFKTYYGALFKPNDTTVAYDINVSAAKVSNVMLKFIKPIAGGDENIPFVGGGVLELTGGVGAINSLNKAS